MTGSVCPDTPKRPAELHRRTIEAQARIIARYTSSGEGHMLGLSIGHLLLVLAIVLILFGPKRLKTLGSDLGTAIKGFRSAVKEEEAVPATKEPISDDELARTVKADA